MNWLDILDYPNDFHVWKPTGFNWITEICRDGQGSGNRIKPRQPLRRSRLINRPVLDFHSYQLKIQRVDYLKKVIYLGFT